MTDSYTLALPADLPAGEYQILAGLYDPVSGQRLPLVRAGEVVGDAYAVATISLR